MGKKYLIFIFIAILTCCSCSGSNETSSEDILYEPSNIVVFKEIDNYQLKAHIFNPADLNDDMKLPAFVFFHGGGWNTLDATVGYEICDYFASLGMVAISFEYRLADQRSITPVECITDAKSAVRWARQHADELHINPDEIVASGESAGGHLAACTGILEGFDETNENLNISATPNALILSSAVVDPTVDSWFILLLQNRTDATNCSPYHHIRQGLPPTILFHGTSDATVAYSTVQAFTNEMVQQNNRCELYSFDGGHMFHLYNEEDADEMMDLMDDFLVSLGYLGTDPE